MPMRSVLIDGYFSHVMKNATSGQQDQVFKEIYRHTMDNRIFNNLK